MIACRCACFVGATSSLKNCGFFVDRSSAMADLMVRVGTEALQPVERFGVRVLLRREDRVFHRHLRRLYAVPGRLEGAWARLPNCRPRGRPLHMDPRRRAPEHLGGVRGAVKALSLPLRIQRERRRGGGGSAWMTAAPSTNPRQYAKS